MRATLCKEGAGDQFVEAGSDKESGVTAALKYHTSNGISPAPGWMLIKIFVFQAAEKHVVSNMFCLVNTVLFITLAVDCPVSC